LSARRRAALQFYTALFTVLGLSLSPRPVARSTDAAGSVAGTLRLRPARSAHDLVGLASYYHPSLHGLLTSSRVPYDENALTAAHRTLPLGTAVRVYNEDTGRWTDVVINDRGPYIKDRVIDLSRRAARRLGIVEDGLAHVRLRVLEMGNNLRVL
jgi:rare lipoprotein A